MKDGLRQALDEALTTVEQGIARSTKPDREGFLMTSHIRQILAKHAAEPVGVSDEAVEAVAKALNPTLWEDDGLLPPVLVNSGRWQKRHEVRAALEAALPHLQPQPVASRDQVIEALYWIDNALRNGTLMTRANLAFEALCNQLGVDAESLTSSRAALDRLRANLRGGAK